jgi:gliding motility-associated-like protein
MKQLLYLWALLLSPMLLGQLAKEHWLPAMFTTDFFNNQYIQVSTPSTDPVKVTLSMPSNPGFVPQTITIKKNQPEQFVITGGANYISRQAGDLLKAKNMGYKVTSSDKIYCNIRFENSSGVHAEFLTSKGEAALGKAFYSVNLPCNNQTEGVNRSFITSIMATEDNTTLTIPNYNPNVKFANGQSLSAANNTFKLNKGQCVMFAGATDTSGANYSADNPSGFIGTKFVSDKDVVMLNGNWSGQNINSRNSDIYMDISAPTQYLGQEYIVIKGNGHRDFGQETPLVVATRNNTSVFVNDNPVALAVLNEGQHFVIPQSNYDNASKPIQVHQNMYIRTSEPVYLYQILNGSGSSDATGGMNFVAPINKFLPNVVDEISMIERLDIYNRTKVRYSANINVVTMKDAVVTLYQDNVATILSDAEPVRGMPDWITYQRPLVKGNITVKSTKPILMGVFGAATDAGYGGIFSGFDKTPNILIDQCLPNAKLVANEFYDSYQWFFNGTAIAGATSFNYIPNPPKKGIYYVEVILNGNKLQSNPVSLKKCELTFDKSFKTCFNTTFEDVISFKELTGPIDNDNLFLATAPKKGDVFLDPSSGTFTYTPNSDFSGFDEFKFKVCTKEVLSECEYFNYQVKVEAPVLKPEPLQLAYCLLPNTTQVNVDLLPLKTQLLAQYAKVEFYSRATSGLISGNSVMLPNNGPKLFVKLFSKAAPTCSEIFPVEIVQYPLAINNNYNTHVVCDDNLDNSEVIELGPLKLLINNQTNDYEVLFYKATDTSYSLPITQYELKTAQENIKVLIKSNKGCQNIATNLLLKMGPKVALPASTNPLLFCDTDDDYLTKVNLKLIENQLNIPQATYSYFASLADLNANKNIINPDVYSNTQAKQAIWLKVNTPNACANYLVFDIQIDVSQRNPKLLDKTICTNATTLLDAGSPNYKAYKWYNAQQQLLGTTATMQLGKGDYTVLLTSKISGCDYWQKVSVYEFPILSIKNIEYLPNNSIVITPEGGELPYEYALDYGAFQLSNSFQNISPGKHLLRIKSGNDCETVSKNISFLEIYNMITPNGDDVNDVVDFSDLSTKRNASFKVYDRYGVEVYNSQNSQNMSWDGKFNGRQVPTASYWYRVIWQEEYSEVWQQKTGWILVNNRENY